MTTAEIMYLPAPPPILSSFALVTLADAAPARPQTTAPPAPQTPPPVPETPPKRRRIFAPLPPPPFKYRVKIGALFPSDGDTRRVTGSTHLRLEADAFPTRVQRGYFRGSAFFVTFGYSQNTQNKGRDLRIGSVSLSQVVTLPGRPTGPEGRRRPSRLSIGASYGFYLLSLSRSEAGDGDGGRTNGQVGADFYADYLVGHGTFVEAKYHTLFGGVNGFFGSGPSLLVGHRF